MTVEVRILKESSCQSLSAKSTLTYQIDVPPVSWTPG
jgi:hypothetical protein